MMSDEEGLQESSCFLSSPVKKGQRKLSRSVLNLFSFKSDIQDMTNLSVVTAEIHDTLE